MDMKFSNLKGPYYEISSSATSPLLSADDKELIVIASIDSNWALPLHLLESSLYGDEVPNVIVDDTGYQVTPDTFWGWEEFLQWLDSSF